MPQPHPVFAAIIRAAAFGDPISLLDREHLLRHADEIEQGAEPGNARPRVPNTPQPMTYGERLRRIHEIAALGADNGDAYAALAEIELLSDDRLAHPVARIVEAWTLARGVVVVTAGDGRRFAVAAADLPDGRIPQPGELVPACAKLMSYDPQECPLCGSLRAENIGTESYPDLRSCVACGGVWLLRDPTRHVCRTCCAPDCGGNCTT